MNDDIILYWVLGILIWGLIWGVVTRSVSSSKGYNDGFAWGFFLGIIGLIVVACRPDNRSNYSYRAGTIVCTACGATNSSSSFHCQNCGAKLAPATLAQKTGKEGQWRCKCGAQNYSYETTCHRCGEKKSEASSKSITEQLEELKKLQEQGLITEADYESKKKQILKL